MPDATNYVAPSQIGETGSLYDSNTETPSFYEQIEGDYLCDISYEEQASSQTFLSQASQCRAFIVSAEAESNNQGEKQETYKEKNVWDPQSYSRKYVPNFLNDGSSSAQIDDTGGIEPNPTAKKGSNTHTRKKPLHC